MTHRSIGFIGTGRIAQALIAGLVRNPETRIAGYDKDPAAMMRVAGLHAIRPEESLHSLATDASILIITVKPYQVSGMLEELSPYMTAEHLLISVAAGISTDFIAGHCPEGTRIIRVMPNTPAFAGEGMTGICMGTHAREEDLLLAKKLFSSVGKVAVVDEGAMDAVTAVSGSGPAYMFSILDSLAEGGAACGLDRQTALLLAAQTMLGSAKMILDGNKNPAELIKEVTTPGGTTEAGLFQMEMHNIHDALIHTVKAAAERSRELMK